MIRAMVPKLTFIKKFQRTACYTDTMTKRKKRILVIVSIVLVVLSVAFFLSRNWIRSTVMPAYADHFYKAAVENSFDENFLPVNKELRKYGFTFDIVYPEYRQDTCWKKDKLDERLRSGGSGLSVPCEKIRFSDPVDRTPEFINYWQRHSPQLHDFLIKQGWHWKRDISQPPINTLFDDPEHYERAMIYSKTHGKVYCQLDIAQDASSPGLPEIYVNEDCGRDVDFLGG